MFLKSIISCIVLAPTIAMSAQHTGTMAALYNMQAKPADCREYSLEQLALLYAANSYGEEYGYERTLPAIVQQESFVKDLIVRTNPSDPSYGVTHITFPTIKWLSGLGHYAAAKEAENIVKDDLLAFNYGIMKLQSVHKTTYWAAWRDYNGRSAAGERYANKIQSIIAEHQRCKLF